MAHRRSAAFAVAVVTDFVWQVCAFIAAVGETLQTPIGRHAFAGMYVQRTLLSLLVGLASVRAWQPPRQRSPLPSDAHGKPWKPRTVVSVELGAGRRCCIGTGVTVLAPAVCSALATLPRSHFSTCPPLALLSGSRTSYLTCHSLVGYAHHLGHGGKHGAFMGSAPKPRGTRC